VTENAQIIPDPQPLSPTARALWTVLILSTLYLCYFSNLGAIGFVGPDEPRYAWIARAMHETGDWITPRLYSQPWFEKPILYYWAAALSFKLFGVSEATARLPSAISALFATLALAWLALRTYGAETARWLLLLLPTTVGMIGFSHAAATDMPFAAALTIAMVFAARLIKILPSSGFSLHTQSSSSHSETGHLSVLDGLAFGFFLGLAVLAKGPAAIILSGGAIFFWALFTKRWRDAFRCLHPAAILSFCITALPWYILCARRNPDFFRIFIIEHNFKRFLTPEFQHIQPFWFYIPILLIAFLPWTIALLWSLVFGSLKFLPAKRISPLTILILCWSLFCLVFFSLSKSKLPGYILPAIPAIGLLLARSFTHVVSLYEKSFRLSLLASSFLTAVVGVVLLAKAHPFSTSRTLGFALVSSACVLLLFGLANLLLGVKDSDKDSLGRAAPLCVAPILLLLLAFRTVASPWLQHDPSGKTLALEITANQIPLDQLYAPAMRRGQLFSLNFYLHRQMESWDPQNPKEGYLLLASRNCFNYLKPPWTCARNPVELPESGWFVYKIEPNDLVRRPSEPAW
jgi:4-amino-4-deoxy-L-arabinose transferase-like glycosyltransferase